jgi:hypothetical protein
MSYFFFTKSETRKTEPVLPFGAHTSGKGRWWGKGVGGCIWCKYHIHMYVNAKMIQ